MGQRLVKLFNTVTRLRRPRCKPEEMLVLLPSCLQSSECRQKITNDIGECLRCGRCKVKDIVELCEKHGVRCAVATGGRLALELASQDHVKAVVAIACEKELREGMKAVFPKPGLGIINIRPHGPCKDTDVEVEEVERAVAWLLRP
jgi:hypothetical protein